MSKYIFGPSVSLWFGMAMKAFSLKLLKKPKEATYLDFEFDWVDQRL